MRVARRLELRPGDRARLAQLMGQRIQRGPGRRAAIVLLAADGLPHTEVARRCGISAVTVRQWRFRYEAEGVAGLTDRPRAGRPRTVDETAVVTATLALPPARLRAARWSSRLLASHMLISSASVLATWRKWGLRPWQPAPARFPVRPGLDTALTGLAGLYLSPAIRAIAVGTGAPPPGGVADHEISALTAALDRAALDRAALDHAALDHAALDHAAPDRTADGCAPSHSAPSDRAGPGSSFLDFLRAAASPGTDVHVVCDRRSGADPALAAWLDRHPRVTVHVTPPGLSWPGLAEICCAVIARQAIRRGTYRSVKDLTVRIRTAHIGRASSAGPAFAWIPAAG
jgi:transposase